MTTVRVYGGKSSMTAPAPSPLLSGLLAGIALIVVWVILVYVTHNGVGLVAWGVGGLLGIVIGFGLARILPVAVSSLPTPVISMPSVLMAFGISVGIGLFFGLYPANRAARLRPIEALRYE